MLNKPKSFKMLVGLLVALLVLATGCSSQTKSSEQAKAPTGSSSEPTKQEKPYFEGKTLRIIVPNSAGGAHDTAARTLAPYIQKYSGAKNVLVENKKGGGGVLGMNELWVAKGDGETIMLASAATHLLTYIAGNEAVKYDPAKTTWLARAIIKPYVLTVGAKSGMKNVDDLKNLNRPFVFSAVGLDDDFYTMSVVMKALGKDLKVVTGFDGEGECQVAQVQGTVDGLFVAHAKADPLVKDGSTNPILILGSQRVKWDGYDKLPTILEVVNDGPQKQALKDIVAIYELYESIWGPPNMDPKATEAWRSILDKVMKDPEVIEKIVKIEGTPAYVPGAELQKQIPEILQRSSSLKATFAEATKLIK
jgi:tripartite-type tricarboxylate transporter receptor subunit TctC